MTSAAPRPPPTEVRRQLRRRGYDPIPVNGKAPTAKGWQQKRDVNDAEIDLWQRIWPDATNTGVLCRLTPVLDIDILSPDAAQAAEDYLREWYEDRGYVLVRIGRSPKRAIPFRTDAPFTKITVNLIAANGAAGQKLEFLGDGQQCVVDGVHPDTNKPYAWVGGNIIDIPHDELPYINAEEARRLIDAIADLLVRGHGYSYASERKPDDAGDSRDWAASISSISSAEPMRSRCGVAKI
jgi:hypothetical protein